MQLLLGEMPIKNGLTTLFGTVSYACQQPWLFTGTVRNNILFGQVYDKRRYNEVIKCCALLTDFEQLPHGDKTIVGERGASLSGGQRARISLARAIYKSAAIYLLDDPLSAVDAHVGKHLFDEVIGPKGRLAQNTTRILVTHQVHFLKEADTIVIVENGRITRQGTYDELANSNLDFAKLLKRDDGPEAIKEESERHSVNYEDEDIAYIDGETGYKALRQRSVSVTKSVNKKHNSMVYKLHNSTEFFRSVCARQWIFPYNQRLKNKLKVNYQHERSRNTSRLVLVPLE